MTGLVVFAVVLVLLATHGTVGFVCWCLGLADDPPQRPRMVLRHLTGTRRRQAPETAPEPDWDPLAPSWASCDPDVRDDGSIDWHDPWPHPSPKTRTAGPPRKVYEVRGIGTAHLDPELRAFRVADLSRALAEPEGRELALGCRTEARLGALSGGAA